jgi:acyl-coenzyme A synthetase/AMP-(fatty) acid ligase
VAAFIASKHDTLPGVIELKEFLGGIVPRYMIPDSIRFVDEIPKNINGKADRRLLTEQANRVKVEKE